MMRELYQMFQDIVGCSRQRAIQISIIFAKELARGLLKDKVLHLKGLCSFRIMERSSRTDRVLNGKKFSRTKHYLCTRFSTALKDDLRRQYEREKTLKATRKKKKK